MNDLESYAARVLSPEEQRHTEEVALAWLKAAKAAIPKRALPKKIPIPSLVEAGILVRRSGGLISFFQSTIDAYFGARAMAQDELSESVESAKWEPTSKALHYYAVLGDPKATVMQALNSNDEPLESGLLNSAR